MSDKTVQLTDRVEAILKRLQEPDAWPFSIILNEMQLVVQEERERCAAIANGAHLYAEAADHQTGEDKGYSRAAQKIRQDILQGVTL